MHVKNNAIISLVAAGLILAFFLPWLQFFISISAWDLLFGVYGKYLDTIFKYVILFIPVSGVLVLYGAAINNGNYAIPKFLLFKVPATVLIVTGIAIAYELSKEKRAITSADLINLMNIFGAGFWLTIAASITLLIIQPKTKSTSLP